MSRRIVAVTLVALLIASVLVGLGVVSAAPAAPSTPSAAATIDTPASSVPAASAITIQTYDASVTPTTEFCTGSCFAAGGATFPGLNTLRLSVEDTAGDLRVNVSINDPNATRDGLVNPVFQATLGINSTTYENVTITNNQLTYTFPSSLVHGGGWNITASAPLGGFENVNLTVVTYSLAVQSSPAAGSVTVPGENVTVSWSAVATANGALFSQFTTLTAWGTYINGTARNLFSPGLYPLTVAGAGSFSFRVPGNATPDTLFSVSLWAVTNLSGGIAENATATLSLRVGVPLVETLLNEPYSGCDDGAANTVTFATGTPVFTCVWIGAEAGTQVTDEVPGLVVSIQFWNGTQNVSASGSPPASLVTVAGQPSSFSFLATNPPFGPSAATPLGNAVNLSVTDPAATSTGYPTALANDSFAVTAASAVAGTVAVSLNAVDYLAGQTVTANWVLGSTDPTTTGPLTAFQWQLYSGVGTTLLGTGPISSTQSSGAVQIPLPAGYLGEFSVYVLANNSTTTFTGLTVGYAVEPTLGITGGGAYFQAGSTLSYAVAVSPSPLPGTTIYYNITGEWGSVTARTLTAVAVVAVGSVGSAGTISYTVPANNPATYYFVDAWAQSPSAGIYSTATAAAELANGYSLQVGVATLSSYSDGSYQPGQTISVSWALSALGPLPPAVAYEVELYFGYGFVGGTWSTSASSGTLSVTIPSNAPSGQLYVEVVVYADGVYGPYCSTGNYCYSETGIMVNAHPSVLSYELGAGSGLTVGWLILLVLLIVVALVLFLALRRGRAPKSPVPMAPATTTSMSPPSPPPSTPPAEEWREPDAGSSEPSAGAGGAPPPLPAPPTESQ
ncbi:MAG: hypothetical protein ACRECT_01945 [Thermoplasmata archaeon]